MGVEAKYTGVIDKAGAQMIESDRQAADGNKWAEDSMLEGKLAYYMGTDIMKKEKELNHSELNRVESTGGMELWI